MAQHAPAGREAVERDLLCGLVDVPVHLNRRREERSAASSTEQSPVCEKCPLVDLFTILLRKGAFVTEARFLPPSIDRCSDLFCAMRLGAWMGFGVRQPRAVLRLPVQARQPFPHLAAVNQRFP